MINVISNYLLPTSGDREVRSEVLLDLGHSSDSGVRGCDRARSGEGPCQLVTIHTFCSWCLSLLVD